MRDFHMLLRSKPFKVIVGNEEVCFNVPSTIARGISEPLHNMMNNGRMMESTNGYAVLKHVESSVFAAFCEYAFTGDYHVPEVAARVESHEEPGSPRPSEVPEDDLLASRPGKSRKKEKRSAWPNSFADDPQPLSEYNFPTSVRDLRHRILQTLWTQFKTLRYEAASSWSESREDQEDNQSETDEVNPLMFHAKVYFFAQEKLAARLESLAICKLYQCLRDSKFSSDEILDAADFVFNPSRGDSSLKQLLLDYICCQVETLKSDLRFHEILGKNSELGRDMLMRILEA